MNIEDISANGKLAVVIFGLGIMAGAIIIGLFAIVIDKVRANAFNRLVSAVSDIYYAAHWSPDQDVSNAVQLWTELRDAAGFPPSAHYPDIISEKEL